MADSTTTRLRFMELAIVSMLTIEMLLTHRLWGTAHAYPRIPFFRHFVALPLWLEWAGLACTILAGCFVLVSFTRKANETASRIWWGVLGVGLIWLVLFDQHRFQTWIWQAILYSFCLAMMKREQSLKWMQLVTIGIYFYSAVSKLDASFVNSYGQTILDGLLNAIHFQPIWTDQTRWWVVLGFPLFELLLALLLIVPRTRLFGLIGSYLMHLALFLALGPWGLNHQTPVLIWNVFFVVQNSILFWPVRVTKTEPETKRKDEARLWPAYAMILSLIFPATQWFDICDIWPGWGLYAAHGARVTLSLDETEVEKIPAQLRHLLADPVFEHSWRKLDCHRFSFEETNAPSYPEDRTQFAVAVALIERYQLQKFEVVHHDTANRWTGKRALTKLNNRPSLDRFSRRFFFNTIARP